MTAAAPAQQGSKRRPAPPSQPAPAAAEQKPAVAAAELGTSAAAGPGAEATAKAAVPAAPGPGAKPEPLPELRTGAVTTEPAPPDYPTAIFTTLERTSNRAGLHPGTVAELYELAALVGAVKHRLNTISREIPAEAAAAVAHLRAVL